MAKNQNTFGISNQISLGDEVFLDDGPEHTHNIYYMACTAMSFDLMHMLGYLPIPEDLKRASGLSYEFPEGFNQND